MSVEAAGRLFRHLDGRWTPIGDPLPAFAHAPPAPAQPFAPWVLPRDPAPLPYDVVVIGEYAQQLLAPCDADDPAVVSLAEHTSMLHGVEAATTWLAGVTVWLGRLLEPDREWPTPPDSVPE